MRWRVDIKSVTLGVGLGAGLCLLVGAARSELLGPVGRFQVSCYQNGAYLVDTITGQVWLNSERDFRPPKLRPEPAPESPAAAAPAPATRPPIVESVRSDSRVETGPAGFIGKWVLTHPTEGQLGIQIDPDGRAVLTEGQKSWEGKWQIQGNQITIATEQETVTARLDDQGRLLVKEGSGEAIAFQRVQ
ncbi:MAG: hypothetical protein ABFD90_05495 [Phycisphaerales bacterium]